MSQNLINDLTDRVSALTEDVSYLTATRNALRAELTATQNAGREVVVTADSLISENKRLLAELDAVCGLYRTLLLAAGLSEHYVETILSDTQIKARNQKDDQKDE